MVLLLCFFVGFYITIIIMIIIMCVCVCLHTVLLIWYNLDKNGFISCCTSLMLVNIYIYIYIYIYMLIYSTFLAQFQ